MDTLKKDLKSGAKLEVQAAPFKEAHALWKAVCREVEKVRIEFGLKPETEKLDFDAVLTDSGLNTVKNLITRLAGSDEVEACLWPCMGRATWNGKRTTDELFEDKDARNDFVEVAREVLLFNVRPFLNGLGSKFSVILGAVEGSQK